MWRCPDCGSKDDIQVYISVWASLIQPDEEPEAFETDIDCQDHEFDGNSGALCKSCGCNGNLDKFEAEDEGDGELPPDPEGMNGQRAEWAEVAVDAFNVAEGALVERARAAVAAFREVCRTDEADAVKDLVCDIRHLCDRWHLDFDKEALGGVGDVSGLLAGLRELSGEGWGAIMLTAEVNYEAETAGEEEGEEDGND